MDFSNLISRLNAIGSLQGSVTEAEEKCPKCGCTPCECDDKEKVEEGKGKKPDFLDADKDGNKKEPMSDALKDEEEKVKESTLDLLRRHSGIQEAAPVNFDKVLDAIAALYGDDMWNNDSMQDLAHDLEQQNPTDQELDSIIATGELPQRLANTQFTNNDSVKFGEALNTSKLGDTMGVDAQQLRMAVSRASAGRQTRSDIMLLSDTFVKLLNNPDDTAIQTVANLIKSGNTTPAPEANMKQEGNEFSGALKAAKDAGAEEFEVGGKKYKVNEDCGDVEMSPLSSMGQMSSSPEHEHNERYTLTITRGDKNLNVTTDNPDELLSIMRLAGISGSTEVVQQAPEQEVEESGYENTPTQTNEREPKAYGDIRDWGMKGTGRGQPGSALNKPSGQGDNPLGEQAMMESYKKFKAGK